MLNIQYTESAKDDLVSLSQVGLDAYGISAVVLYNRLIRYTVDQLSSDPDQVGAKEVTKVSEI